MGPQELRGARVLVVDDDADNRELLVVILEQHGAVVASAGSADEALKVLEKEGSQVLVSDIGLPDEDGYGLLRKIRALPSSRGGSIPAIALTGYSTPEVAARIREAGFLARITKPVAFDELVATIAAALRSPTQC